MLRTSVAALAIALLGVTALWRGTDGFRAFTAEEARRLTILEHPRLIPNVLLIDMWGNELKLIDYKDSSVVVEFIYTSCPSICAILGESFAKLQDAAKAAGLSDRVRFISISFDLARDGPPALRNYADAHGADGQLWTIARPDNERDLRTLLDAFSVIVIPDGAGGFVHNAALYVVGREGRLKAIFDIGDEAQVLAAVRSEQ